MREQLAACHELRLKADRAAKPVYQRMFDRGAKEKKDDARAEQVRSRRDRAEMTPR